MLLPALPLVCEGDYFDRALASVSKIGTTRAQRRQLKLKLGSYKGLKYQTKRASPQLVSNFFALGSFAGAKTLPQSATEMSDSNDSGDELRAIVDREVQWLEAELLLLRF
jgi:hypothetical protein